MDNESFYIVLPSNTPFPENRTSEFVVKLPNIINLSDGNWTVSLSSIIYPLTFSGFEEQQKITIHFDNDSASPLVVVLPRQLQFFSARQLATVLNNEVLKYYYKYTTELKAASSAETKVVKKHKRQLNSKQQEVYNQIDALNVQSDLDSIKQSIERTRLQLSDIIYLIDTVDGVLENKLTLFKEDITAKDETTETLLHEIKQDKQSFYDLKDKARKQVDEVEQLIQDVQKPLTDSNVKEAREIANRIKQISVSIIGDANTGKKGITAEIHDLKEKLLKNNEKYIQIWLDEDANKIYLEIEALKIDFNRTYRRIQIIHEDLLSILKNIEHESTDEICEKKKSRNDIIDKITPIIGFFANFETKACNSSKSTKAEVSSCCYRVRIYLVLDGREG